MKKYEKGFRVHLFVFIASYIFSTFFSEQRRYNPQVIISKDQKTDFFAICRCGKLYICSTENYKEFLLKVTENDILAVDERNWSNPNIKIVDSYRIQDLEVMNDVLVALQEYEKEYPSSWDRSIESMRNEWIIHNILYNLSLEKERTKNVDLDNEDEKLYDSPILKRILKD